MCPRLEPVWNCGRPVKYQTSLRCCYQGMRPCGGSVKSLGDRRPPLVFNSSLFNQKLPVDSKSDMQGFLVRQKRLTRSAVLRLSSRPSRWTITQQGTILPSLFRLYRAVREAALRPLPSISGCPLPLLFGFCTYVPTCAGFVEFARANRLDQVSMIAGSSARDRAAISTVRPAEPRRMSLSGNFKRQTRGAPRRDRKDEPFVVGAE